MARPAIVLGSAQPDGVVDAAVAAAMEVDVVRRRSGGGAVLLQPERVVWADVFVPADDGLWQADVGRAFFWLGDAWAEAVRSLGFAEVSVHRGGMVKTALSDNVCFAGLGPGEVSIGARKVVGVSQRRTRAGALFQCACLLSWNPAPLVDLLRLGDGALVALAGVATGLEVGVGVGVGGGVGAAEVETALVAALG